MFVQSYVCSVLCLICLCARLLICILWSPAGKGLTSWLSFVVYNGEFVIFGILGQVWYLIVSISDLCTLTYFFILLVISISEDPFFSGLLTVLASRFTAPR